MYQYECWILAPELSHGLPWVVCETSISKCTLLQKIEKVRGKGKFLKRDLCFAPNKPAT
jgi:hypothetical protein